MNSITQLEIPDAGFRGKLIASHPKLKDNNFDKAVILIFEDIPTIGTRGIIINKQSLTTVNQICSNSFSFKSCLYSDRYVGYGGPVNEGSLIMVHSNEWYSSNTMPLSNKISISGDNLMFEKLADHNAPKDWMIIAGQAAWRPEQLQEEVNREMWLVADCSPNVIFGNDNNRWQRTIELAGEKILQQFF